MNFDLGPSGAATDVMDDASSLPLAVPASERKMRPLDNPQTFVQDAAHNGFTPGQALALFHEKRFFWRHTVLAWPTSVACDPLYATMKQKIGGVCSPQEWDAYVNDWAALDRDELRMLECPSFSASPWWQHETDPTLDQSIREIFPFAKRGSTGVSLPWISQTADPGFGPWTWMSVHRAITRDFKRTTVPKVSPRPARWTFVVGQRNLARLMRRLGMSGVQWPWEMGESADVTWEIFCVLRKVQQEIVRVSGWTGPVLGLGSGLWLRLGHELDSSGSGLCWHREGCPLISTSWSGWHQVLSHEWVHCLDSALAQSASWSGRYHSPYLLSGPNDRGLDRRWHAVGTASSGYGQMRPWAKRSVDALLKDLAGVRTAPADEDVERAEQQEWLFGQGFSELFHGGERAPEELKLWRQFVLNHPCPDRLTFRNLLRNGASRGGRSFTEARDRDEFSSLFPAVLKYAHPSRPTAWAGWLERCDRLARDITRRARFPHRVDRKTARVWWNEPCERLAMAFEYSLATWVPNTSHWRGPLLPTRAESAQIEGHFQTFFRRLAPWWRHCKNHGEARRLGWWKDALKASPSNLEKMSEAFKALEEIEKSAQVYPEPVSRSPHEFESEYVGEDVGDEFLWRPRPRRRVEAIAKPLFAGGDAAPMPTLPFEEASLRSNQTRKGERVARWRLRDLNQPKTFAKDAANNGFTPAEAMALFHEKRFFLRHHVIAELVEHSPQYEQVRERVRAIQRPDQWWDYVHDWASGKWRVPTGNACSIWWESEGSDLFVTPDEKGGDPWEMRGFAARCGHGEAWGEQPNDDLGWVWTWMEVHRVIREAWDVPRPTDLPPMPACWTEDAGRTHLRDFLRQSGMSGVQWPWEVGDSAEILWNIYCGLANTQQSLRSLTGWAGPVLGLNAGLWLRLGHDLGSHGGSCITRSEARPFITTTWDGWRNVLLHEWFHVLDQALALSSLSTGRQADGRRSPVFSSGVAWWPINLLSEGGGPARPTVDRAMKTLVADLKAALPPNQDDYTAWSLRWFEGDGFKEWIGQSSDSEGLFMARWRALVSGAKSKPSLMRVVHRQGLYKGSRAAAGLVQNRDHDAMGEVYLKYALGIYPRASWWQRCDDVGAHLRRRGTIEKGKRNIPHTWWEDVCERLAMAFENRVYSLLPPTRPHSPVLPTDAEALAMEPHWQAFFKRLTPWWRHTAQRDRRVTGVMA